MANSPSPDLNPDWIFVDLSADQCTQIGNVLFLLYYRQTKYPHLSLLDQREGYPHHAGEHSLYFRARRGDALAFLDLLVDDFPKARKPLTYLYQDIASEKRRSYSIRPYVCTDTASC
jgi:hypothetical protein